MTHSSTVTVINSVVIETTCFVHADITSSHTTALPKMSSSNALLLSLGLLLMSMPHAHAREEKHHHYKTRVDIAVYYECMCPFSINFITTQLWPTYTRLGFYMKVRLFPFGNGVKRLKVDRHGRNVTRIQCQHGDNECKGNTVQCCVLEQHKSTVIQMGFVACMMSADVPYKAGQKCAKQIGIRWKSVEKCASGEHGKMLLLQMGEKTWSAVPKVKSVPHIVVNGVHNSTISSRARTNLLLLICELLHPHAVPKPCKHYFSKAE